MKNNFEAMKQVAYVIFNDEAPVADRWQIRCGTMRFPKNFVVAYVRVWGSPTIATSPCVPDLPDYVEAELDNWECESVYPVLDAGGVTMHARSALTRDNPQLSYVF